MSYYASEEIFELESEIDTLKNKLNKARNALKFYSDFNNYAIKDSYHPPEVMEDRGKIANDCLNKISK